MKYDSTLHPIVTSAPQREMKSTPSSSHRLDKALLELAPDAPLRTLSLDEIKRLDAEAVEEADEAKARSAPETRSLTVGVPSRVTAEYDP